MHIEYAFESGTLPTIVVERQQLESGIFRGAQITFYLIFVAKRLESATGSQKLFSLLFHTVVAKQVTEDFKIPCLISTCVLGNLFEIRKSAPLALFMGNNRRGVRTTSRRIIAREFYLGIIVVRGLRGMTIPVESSCSTFHMIFRTSIPGPSSTYTGPTIYFCGIVVVHFLHPVVAVADPVSCRLVASCHHDE